MAHCRDNRMVVGHGFRSAAFPGMLCAWVEDTGVTVPAFT